MSTALEAAEEVLKLADQKVHIDPTTWRALLSALCKEYREALLRFQEK